MSLKHTILAMLEAGDSTGYTIAKGFEGAFSFLASARHQQVYQELAKLTASGFVSYHVVTQPNSPDRKVYRITPDGLQELKWWIQSSPTDLPKTKDPLMVKLFAGHLADPLVLMRQIAVHQKLHQKKLDALSKLTVTGKLRQLTLKRNISVHELWLEWAKEVQAVLSSAEPQITALHDEALSTLSSLSNCGNVGAEQ